MTEEAQQDTDDLLEEARETTIIRSARYQQTLRRYHERKIRGRILEVRDLVLQRTQSTKEKHKLSPPWEGPYTVKALVWFWLIDKTLSANLVYQSDYEIGSTTPSGEANEDHDMMMVMAL